MLKIRRPNASFSIKDIIGVIKDIPKILRVAMFMAPKAIFRGNLGITALTICMLAIVSMNLLFVPGLIDGIINSGNSILKKTYSGDLIVESDRDTPYISHAKELADKIETISGVKAVSNRNNINGEIEYEDDRVSCIIYGVDAPKEKQVFNISDAMIEGQYLDSRDRDQIILGAQLAGADITSLELYSSSLKHVHAGDKVDVTFGTGQKKQYTVKGIFHTGYIQTDAQAFISDVEYESVIPAAKNKAMSLRVKLDDKTDPNAVIAQILALPDTEGLRCKTWMETAGIMQSMTDSFALIKQILNIVNILVAGITVFIVTYVDVVNRRRQIGIQRAIGIKPQSITISYIIRALFYAAIGLIAGILIYKYVIIPLETSNPFYFPFGPAFLSINPSLVGSTIIILVTVSVVASFLPVWRVMRTSILNAIWG
jgi:putative ABC transport system permease protein